MLINKVLQELNMSRYRLSKESGIPITTINDICSGKTNLNKCSAGTLYRIAGALNISVDMILDDYNKEASDYRCSFEVFKSNTCHLVKDLGDLDFIVEVLETDEIRSLYNKRWYKESLYLLAMVDYLSRLNNIPLCNNYNDIRCQKLENTVFPVGILLSSRVKGDDSIKSEAIANSIPEFIRFNIVESEIRNVI